VAGWPLLRTVYYAFTDATLYDVEDHGFVGLLNFYNLATDPDWWRAVWNTVFFAAVSVALETVLGTVIALTLNARMRGRGLMRAVMLIPWAIPTVVSSQMWRFIFNDRYGLFNFILFGGDTAQYVAPLADPQFAMLAIMAAEIWKTAPFAALIILAGLQTISDEVYEAASIDGANSWQKFRHVTLPLLWPALLLALLFRTIDALRVFDLVFVMTQGGPADATNVLQFYGYKKTFAEGMIGYGSTIAVTVFTISLIFALAYLRALKSERLQGAAR
jgi:ABC-type sugar transport system permease subunit